MKKAVLLLCSLFVLPAIAQDHYSGVTTSKRVGILNATINPSELANLSKTYEVNVFSASANISNNKVGFGDLVNGSNLEDKIFEGTKSVNFNIDGQLTGPGFAMKKGDWGFAITSAAHIKANVVDVNSELGRAITEDNFNAVLIPSLITNSQNQRVNATTWGEIGLSAARKIYEDDEHRFNGGITFKLLFPGSYANIGLSNFAGTISYSPDGLRLNNVDNANLNLAYSGSLAENFKETSDYFQSLFGNLNGISTDIGFDYQWNDADTESYKLKVGASVKNIGSMTFKDENNVSRNYSLNINEAPGGGLNLNDFNNVDGLEDIENVLLDSGYLTLNNEKKDFKAKLPTLFNLYADYSFIPKLSVTVFWQQKMKNDDKDNQQITAQNSFTIIPRTYLGIFEVYVPVAFNEISGTTAGLGLSVGGFFIGSNSIITAAADSNQADAYIGYRFGFL